MGRCTLEPCRSGRARCWGTEVRLGSYGLSLVLSAGLIGGCDPGEPGGPGYPTLVFEVEFDSGTHGFSAGFADYSEADADSYDLTSDHRTLPAPLGARSGLFIAGTNHSDDLFMFFKGSVTGLAPGVRYQAAISLEIATDVPSGCVGIGGAPGESVAVKGGAAEVEPMPVLDGPTLRMNIDVGVQSNSGTRAVVLGDIANSRRCGEPSRWEVKPLGSQAVPEPVTATPSGRSWILFGTDSGFEGRTRIYFTRVTVSFTPI